MSTAEAEQYLITVFRPLLAVQSSSVLYVEAKYATAERRLDLVYFI
jgi:hypothetical protein